MDVQKRLQNMVMMMRRIAETGFVPAIAAGVSLVSDSAQVSS